MNKNPIVVVMATGVESLVKSAAANPPEKYILKDGVGGTDFPAMDVAVIDVALLTSSSPCGEKEVEKLGLALSDSGYIQVVNHGIEEWLLKEVRGMSKQFFSLEHEEKMKCARGGGDDDFEGYGNDTVFSQNQTLDWNDRLYLKVKPHSHSLINLRLWPQNPPNFRKIVMDLTSKLEKVDEVMMKAMGKYLKMEDEGCFLKQYGKYPSVLYRFNHYPPCRRPDAVLAAKAHSDASAVTYLLQDEQVEGLQTLKDGNWYKVPIVPNAILLNIGDQMEVMSNGIFKSPIHRVVTNAEKERMTVAIFFSPDASNEIGPLEELIDEKRPRLFKSVVDYPHNTFQSIQTGKRAFDFLRL